MLEASDAARCPQKPRVWKCASEQIRAPPTTRASRDLVAAQLVQLTTMANGMEDAVNVMLAS